MERAITNENEINDWTAFEEGVLFDGEEEVREYFTVENMQKMFNDPSYQANQEDLDIMANAVIRHRWHMKDANP